MLPTTEFAITHLLTPLLRLTTNVTGDGSSFFTFTHIASNVMRGHNASLRHSVEHYKTVKDKRGNISVDIQR